jgi:hypothetical protein
MSYTVILDDTFHRADGPVGNGWTDATGGNYSIVSDFLNVTNAGGWLYWSGTGTNQAMTLDVVFGGPPDSNTIWIAGVRFQHATAYGYMISVVKDPTAPPKALLSAVSAAGTVVLWQQQFLTGTPTQINIQAQGTNPTTLTVSVYDTTSTPVLLGGTTLTDSTAVLQTSGAWAIGTNSSGNTAFDVASEAILSELIVTFTFTASTLSCSNRLVTLTWNAANAATASISPVIGTVATSGSTSLYVNQTTTYTITAVDAGGGVWTDTVTVSVPSSMVIVPWVGGRQVYYFNGGASYAAGVYLITCCGGAFSWNGSAIGVNANDRKIETSQAFKVLSSQGLSMDTPGHYVGYGSLSASDAGNNGLTQILNHGGGPIGIALQLDDYSRTLEEIENPGFSIAGPAPLVYMVANSTPAIAGTGLPLTWAVTGSTDAGGISIDQGVGVVAASGSITVSPTVTTRYTLTATYMGLTVTTYADVLIGSPSVPGHPTPNSGGAGPVFTPSCGGTVVIAWGTPAFTTSTLIERSTSPNSGFTQIASVAFGTLSYTDTPPVQGTTYYYRLRNTDGTNYSQYYVTVSSATLVPPAAVSNLTVSAPLGIPVLGWTAMPGATSYLVRRATAAGGTVTAYTLAVTSPGQVFAGVQDPQAPRGVLCDYWVVGVNGCGSGAASNEVSVVAGVVSSPYV